MWAVEFETHAKNGMIKIPEKYREMADGELKIIILKQQEKKPKISGKSKNTNIRRLVKQIKTRNIFHTIQDPVEWQRTIRDEWS
jgi:hypothetical protein